MYKLSKLLVTAIFIISLFSLLSVNAFAAATRVRGNAYDESNGGKGIQGLLVTVTCTNDKTSKTKTATTNKNGLYKVLFGNKCDTGDAVTTTATYKGQTLTQTVFVSDVDTATSDFYFGAVSVPEFGLIPGVIALVGSTGSFFALRKKK